MTLIMIRSFIFLDNRLDKQAGIQMVNILALTYSHVFIFIYSFIRKLKFLSAAARGEGEVELNDENLIKFCCFA